MQVKYLLVLALLLHDVVCFGQVRADSSALHDSYAAKEAIEVESLFPMFIYGGYHFCVGYRYENFRVRISVIDGGRYDAEPAGISNSSATFKRYYLPSPGIFAGYNVWKGLELYTYLEDHLFQIEEKSTGRKQDMRSIDSGVGLSYQYFFGKLFYVQPGVHFYFRSDKELQFETRTYRIPNVDVSPVIRIGFRLWEKD